MANKAQGKETKTTAQLLSIIIPLTPLPPPNHPCSPPPTLAPSPPPLTHIVVQLLQVHRPDPPQAHEVFPPARVPGQTGGQLHRGPAPTPAPITPARPTALALLPVVSVIVSVIQAALSVSHSGVVIIRVKRRCLAVVIQVKRGCCGLATCAEPCRGSSKLARVTLWDDMRGQGEGQGLGCPSGYGVQARERTICAHTHMPRATPDYMSAQADAHTSTHTHTCPRSGQAPCPTWWSEIEAGLTHVPRPKPNVVCFHPTARVQP